MPSIFSFPIGSPRPDTPVINKDNTLSRIYQQYFYEVLQRTGGVFSGILTNYQFDEQLHTLEYLAGNKFTFNGTLDINNAWQIMGANVHATANELNYLVGLDVPDGGIIYSNGTALRSLANVATAYHVLMSGAGTTPQWSTATYIHTTTENSILFSSANNVVDEIPSMANAVLVTDSTGVPMWANTLPDVVINASLQIAFQRSWMGI